MVMGAAVLPHQYELLVVEQEVVLGDRCRDFFGSSAILVNQPGYEADVEQHGHLCKC